MTSLDILKMALRNLTKRKMRTALTILSVVIGASSIIIMVSLGIALDESFEKQIEKMGSITNVELSVNYGAKNGITTDVINKIKALEGVTAVTPVLRSELRVITNTDRYVGTIAFLGIDPQTAEIFGYTPIEGRTLSESDKGTLNAVINPLIAYSFEKKGKAGTYPKWIYSEEDLEPNAIKVDLLNQTVKISSDLNYGAKKDNFDTQTTVSNSKIKTYKLKIVGVVEKTEAYGENYIIMPVDSLEKINKEVGKIQSGIAPESTVKSGYEKVLVKCENLDIVDTVINNIKDIGDFQVFSQAEYIKTSKKLNMSIQLLLGAIGSISLFIAAIGIANTMIMSIYERTKEIGIMKVIGARVSDIKKLFLLEAILIGFLGGGIGLLFSYMVSFGLNKLAPYFMSGMGLGMDMSQESVKISSIPFSLAITALMFASFIGLMAGYFPAKRAVKIEALKAIKSE